MLLGDCPPSLAEGGQGGAAPSIKTDRGVYTEPPLPKLPKAGGTFVDPTFGTAIMRVTDEADGKNCLNASNPDGSSGWTPGRVHPEGALAEAAAQGANRKITL